MERRKFHCEGPAQHVSANALRDPALAAHRLNARLSWLTMLMIEHRADLLACTGLTKAI